MPKRDSKSTYDDGHAIADMSGVREGIATQLSRALDARKDVARKQDGPLPPARDAREELSGPEEQAAVILGTLKAALSLGMVYVVVFGLAIALMIWLWT